MARGINDIDPVVSPQTSGGSGSNRNASFLLLDHPVHGRRPLVHLANFIVDPSVVQDPLGGGGFTGINMSHDADITSSF